MGRARLHRQGVDCKGQPELKELAGIADELEGNAHAAREIGIRTGQHIELWRLSAMNTLHQDMARHSGNLLTAACLNEAAKRRAADKDKLIGPKDAAKIMGCSEATALRTIKRNPEAFGLKDLGTRRILVSEAAVRAFTRRA